MIDVALATGMPVKMSPKFWAEHMGMPYHQADIRELEMPKQAKTRSGLMALSSGSRSFLALRLWRSAARGPQVGGAFTGSGRARSGCCCGATR